MSQSSGSRGSLIASINNQSIINYNVTGLKSSATYYFTMSVTNNLGGYSDSNQVSGTTAGGIFSPVSLPDFAVDVIVIVSALIIGIPIVRFLVKRYHRP
jgi:hypothetical protein